MPNSSNPPTPGPTYPANYGGIDTSINEAKIASYMWYIHVTVRVNAPDRLRHSLAHILGQGPTTSAPASPSYFGFVDIQSAGSRTLGHGGDGGCAANTINDLTDYLVLHHFSWAMLEILINTAPIEEHAEGYARALAGIPTHFREEFCRRLYCLLFSKYIVEWPQGIAAPEPAPGSIAAAAAAATNTESETVAASTGSEATVDERRSSSAESSRGEDADKDESMSHIDQIFANMNGNLTDDEDAEDADIIIVDKDDITAGEKCKHLANTCPASPDCQSTLGPSSPRADTPSPGYNPELARAAYFGTVSDPLPIQYRESWGRGSMDDGSARGACAEARTGQEMGGEYAHAAAGGSAGDASASHDESLRFSSASSTPRHRRQHEHQHRQAPPQATPQTPQTPQCGPASLLGSAHNPASHTGSCCPCRASSAWSHGVGAQR
ncbi:hypothetical protein F5883DRAFT_685496 [Diaporthe sp. PMI_573]|nr:hypothetical protein F5883DRAFT_685496 [Diaporthaceae sp. PMI_573]